MFLEMMARNPLQQFVDLMVDKLSLVNFSSRRIDPRETGTGYWIWILDV